MRQANTLEARKVIKSILGDKLNKGYGSTWTDRVPNSYGQRYVSMALTGILSAEQVKDLENELNSWMRLSGYTNKVTVRDSERSRGRFASGQFYVRSRAQSASKY